MKISLSKRTMGANLEKASLNIFTNCDEGCLVPVNLQQANLRNAMFSETRLEGANLRQAELQGAYLPKAALSGACLERADLTGAYLKAARFDAVEVTEICKDRLIVCPTLNMLGVTYLPAADLRHANLTSANLINTGLKGADLRGANLTSANLNGADIAKAQLDGAILSRADLRGVVNLRPEQLQQGCVDAATQLPPDFKRPQRPEWCDKPWLQPSPSHEVHPHAGPAAPCAVERATSD